MRTLKKISLIIGVLAFLTSIILFSYFIIKAISGPMFSEEYFNNARNACISLVSLLWDTPFVVFGTL